MAGPLVRRGEVDQKLFLIVCGAGLLGWLGVSFGTTSEHSGPAEPTVSADHADAHRRGALPAEVVDLPRWDDRLLEESEPVLVLIGPAE